MQEGGDNLGNQHFAPLPSWKVSASRMAPKGISFGLLGPIRLLRERFDWDDVTLDQAWAGLIEEAARRYVEGGG